MSYDELKNPEYCDGCGGWFEDYQTYLYDGLSFCYECYERYKKIYPNCSED